ncbi:MAG TPA: hypothetical protein VJ343_00420, partial [archaeon]|nr:hypothetical protein [archaeon]
RKEFNKRRDEILEKNVKAQLEKRDDKTLYYCAKIFEPFEAERFRRIRKFYRGLRSFVKKFKRADEYRWDYETSKIQYRQSRRQLVIDICNYILHPKKTHGEYPKCNNDDEIKIIRKRNRDRIFRIKEGILRRIGRRSPLYNTVVEYEDNSKYQNIHQQMEHDDMDLIKTVMSRICPHSDHDFFECPNLKSIKKELRYSIPNHLIH